MPEKRREVPEEGWGCGGPSAGMTPLTFNRGLTPISPSRTPVICIASSLSTFFFLDTLGHLFPARGCLKGRGLFSVWEV